MRNQIKIVLGAAAMAFSLWARVGRADTISIHDLSQDPVNGVFQYTIDLDAAADIQNGDGFVIYDFPGLISYTISGLKQSDYEVVQTLTSNSLNQSLQVDAAASVAAATNSITFDNPTIENLSFVDINDNPLLGAHTAVLTLYTSVLGGVADSVYASVDNSGVSIDNPYGIAEGPISVPVAGQLPPATGVPEISAGGLASLAIVMLGALALLEGSKLKRPD